MDLSKLFSLQGKVAIITGASGELGSSIAEYFGAAGAKVVITDKCQDGLTKLTTRLNKKGYTATGIPCNVGNPDDLAILVKETIGLYGQLDVLVNNAGADPVYGRIQELSVDDFDQLMDLNVKGPFVLSKLCLQYLRESSSASIINIGASEGIRPQPKLSLYSVSKAALIALTKALAKEWGGYQVRVNVICPGLFKTAFSEIMWSNDEIMVNRMKSLPIPRMCESKEVAAMALFLACPASNYTTGTVMTVDGGFNL